VAWCGGSGGEGHLPSGRRVADWGTCVVECRIHSGRRVAGWRREGGPGGTAASFPGAGWRGRRVRGIGQPLFRPQGCGVAPWVASGGEGRAPRPPGGGFGGVRKNGKAKHAP